MSINVAKWTFLLSLCASRITSFLLFTLSSAFSARSPCYLCPHADVTISVLREVRFNTVLARYHFSSRLWSWFTRRTRRCVPVYWNSFVHKIFCEFFWPFWQITERASPNGLVVSIFVCVFGFSWFMRPVSPYCATRTLTSLLMRNAV